MKLITVEEHFDTQENIKNFNQFSKVLNNNPFQEQLNTDLTNFDTRLAYMDQNGINMQIISDAGNSPQVLPDDMTVAACATQNDSLAAAVATHPDRFAGLAVLPVNVPDKAAQELERAVTQLGLKGGIISGTINGQFLDNPKFDPIFAAAEKLNVPLYLHPGVITDEQKQLLFDSPAYSPMMATMMAGAAWGWHMEQGIQITRLILGGVFEKYPNLKLISGHWGEFVPMFIERLDVFTGTPGFSSLSKPFSSYYRHNVYVTPSGMLTAPQLELVRTEMGADHMLYSEDYPYVKCEAELRNFIDHAALSAGEKEAFAHGTAEQLFNL